MNHWTLKRRASFWIHAIIVIVPFLFSTVSAWLFWYGLFHNGLIASAMIVVVDALALTGLVLYITRIASPFQVLRHALPFVSIVPLGIELYGVLEPNGWGIAALIATLATAIMVTVAALCFRTIEELFIPPLDAAREKAEHDVAHLQLMREQLRVVDSAVNVFRQLPAPQLTVVDAPLTADKKWLVEPGVLAYYPDGIPIPVDTQPAEVVTTVPPIALPLDIVHMHDTEGLSFRAIGAQLGISGQAAQKRYEKVKA